MLALSVTVVAMAPRTPAESLLPPITTRVEVAMSLDAEGNYGCTCNELVAGDLTPSETTTVDARMGALDESRSRA